VVTEGFAQEVITRADGGSRIQLKHLHLTSEAEVRESGAVRSDDDLGVEEQLDLRLEREVFQHHALEAKRRKSALQVGVVRETTRGRVRSGDQNAPVSARRTVWKYPVAKPVHVGGWKV
jgi:hypothetical protein